VDNKRIPKKKKKKSRFNVLPALLETMSLLMAKPGESESSPSIMSLATNVHHLFERETLSTMPHLCRGAIRNGSLDQITSGNYPSAFELLNFLDKKRGFMDGLFEVQVPFRLFDSYEPKKASGRFPDAPCSSAPVPT
jgi:hypothetical protein